MGVTRPGNVFTARTILHCQRALCDHLTSIGANDMDAQDSIRFRISQELDHPVSLQVRLRS